MRLTSKGRYAVTAMLDVALNSEAGPVPLADISERQGISLSYLEQTLLATGFIRENHPGQVMNKLRRLFTRARPESQELNILRGILASIEQQNKGNKA